MSRATVKGIDYGSVLGEQRIRARVDARDAKFFYAALGVVLLVLAVLFVYLWSRVTVTQTGYEISAAGAERAVLVEKNKRLKLELSSLKSPERLEAGARAMGLDYPGGDRVVRVK